MIAGSGLCARYFENGATEIISFELGKPEKIAVSTREYTALRQPSAAGRFEDEVIMPTFLTLRRLVARGYASQQAASMRRRPTGGKSVRVAASTNGAGHFHEYMAEQDRG
ncbi:hypothetical protein A6B35_33525 (plasmid) [Mesorhizobium amorphae CCNWGS0123]|nr:hypothetical protein A6B35_33525 [Mesorhizobium amorphae CCNWGS0123]